mmetsp:Transcript_18715/g.55906  ORF Transcript_18715/g.55906 Transcript_18715/m.55906 type:complete len:102 (-) Transcript_18715:649-954(-)
MISALNDFQLFVLGDARAALGQPVWGVLRELFLQGQTNSHGINVSRMRHALQRDLWKHHYSQDEQKSVLLRWGIRRASYDNVDLHACLQGWSSATNTVPTG